MDSVNERHALFRSGFSGNKIIVSTEDPLLSHKIIYGTLSIKRKCKLDALAKGEGTRFSV